MKTKIKRTKIIIVMLASLHAVCTCQRFFLKKMKIYKNFKS